MISQKIRGNTESESYNNSLLDCKNFYIRQTGGVFKRPGTVFVEAIPAAMRMKLFPYNFPDNKSIVLGIVSGSIYAFSRDGLITRCDANELSDQVINGKNFILLQNGSNMYVFSDVGIFEIQYDPETKNLTFAEKSFTFPPVGRINQDKEVTALYNANVVTLSSSLFKDSDVGQKVLLIWERPLDPSDSSTKFIFETQLVYAYFTITSIEEGGASAAVTFDKDFSSFDAENKIPTGTTYRFALPAFGKDRGWPIAAGALAGRLFLADKDLMILGSRLSFDDMFDFALGADESCGISTRLTSDVGSISWIVGQEKLFVGTPTGIFVSNGAGVFAEDKITPANINLKKFSSIHAGRLVPTAINATIVFTDVLAKNVYEISVDESVGVYKTFDLSLLSNELLNSGCISHAWSSYPVKTYWVACKDGTLASMTYEKANNVLAWSYHELGGDGAAVESVASIQVDGYDFVFCVVRRNANGQIIRNVEYIEKLYEPLDKKQYQQHYVDAGLQFKYGYPILAIGQYAPPILSWNPLSATSADLKFEWFLPNENSQGQFLKIALSHDTTEILWDCYVEKAWQSLTGTGARHNFFSVCEILEKVEHLAPDGRERRTFSQVPIDVHKLDGFGDVATPHRMLTHVQGILPVQGDRLVLFCDPADIPEGMDLIILRGTGIKDSDGSPLDSDAPESHGLKYMQIISRDISAFTPAKGILIRLENGYQEGSFNKDGLNEIYSYSVGQATIDKGTNSKVLQACPRAIALAMQEVVSLPEIKAPGCHGVRYNGDDGMYYVAYNDKIWRVSSDWSSWTDPVSSLHGFTILKLAQQESGRYPTAITSNWILVGRVDGGSPWIIAPWKQVFIDSQGILSKGFFVLSKANVLWIYAGEGFSPSLNKIEFSTDVSAVFLGNTQEANSHVCLVFVPQEDGTTNYQVFGINGKTFEGTFGENETRKVADGYSIRTDSADAISGSCWVVGENGLFFSGIFNNVGSASGTFTWTQIDTGYNNSWKGIVPYGENPGEKFLLWGEGGELLLADLTTNTFKFQQINVPGYVQGVYSANNRVFIALSDGHILRSIDDSLYTQTAFNFQYVFIDDVVGMEGINKKKFVVRNVDNSKIGDGRLLYELWDGDRPADTRPFGVYDLTASNNGTAYMFFNKIVGLGHLADQKVTVCLDGNFLMETQVTTNGIVSFEADVFGMEAHVGYKYSADLALMPLSGGNMRGSSVGSVGSQKPAFVDIYYGLGGKYGTESDNMYPISYPKILFRSSYDRVKDLYSGLIECPVVNPRDIRERTFRLEHSEPVSFNVLSIAQDAEISDA